MYRSAVAGQLLIAFCLASACGGEDENGPANDGPAVDRTQPADGDSGVDPEVMIRVWFDGEIDRNRIGDDHLYLERDGQNLYGRVSYDLGQKLLSLNMTAPLAAGSYQAVLKAGVCDLDGRCSKEDLLWSFAVGE